MDNLPPPEELALLYEALSHAAMGHRKLLTSRLVRDPGMVERSRRVVADLWACITRAEGGIPVFTSHADIAAYMRERKADAE